MLKGSVWTAQNTKLLLCDRLKDRNYETGTQKYANENFAH